MRLLPSSIPIVNKNGSMVDHFRIFMNEVSGAFIISGTGSPEGAIEGTTKQLYMDSTSSPWHIMTTLVNKPFQKFCRTFRRF